MEVAGSNPAESARIEGAVEVHTRRNLAIRLGWMLYRNRDSEDRHEAIKEGFFGCLESLWFISVKSRRAIDKMTDAVYASCMEHRPKSRDVVEERMQLDRQTSPYGLKWVEPEKPRRRVIIR